MIHWLEPEEIKIAKRLVIGYNLLKWHDPEAALKARQQLVHYLSA